MSYSKIWTPSTTPSGLVLNEWKALIQEIDHALLDNMWILDETATNLDFSSIDSLPAPSGNFIGSRTYILNDTHRHIYEIYLRVSFGINHGAWSNYTNTDNCVCPSFRIEISSLPTFPATLTFTSMCPSQHSSNTPFNTSLKNPYPGTSVVSYQPEVGFYSFIFGIGSIQTGNRVQTNMGLSIPRMSSFNLVIQRHMDEYGTIIPGFTCLGQPNILSYYLLEEYYRGRICSLRSISGSYQTPTVLNHSPIPFEGQTIAANGMPQVTPMFTLMPRLMQLPACISYSNIQISPFTEFEAETPLGRRTFLALGDESSFILGLNHRLAILIK